MTNMLPPRGLTPAEKAEWDGRKLQAAPPFITCTCYPNQRIRSGRLYGVETMRGGEACGYCGHLIGAFSRVKVA